MAEKTQINDLAARKCKPCEGGAAALKEEEVRQYLSKTPGWELDGKILRKTYQFKNYYQTTAFVNAVAWISHREDHHPDISFGYKTCEVAYTTHAAGGLTENDFICAAKVDELLSND